MFALKVKLIRESFFLLYTFILSFSEIVICEGENCGLAVHQHCYGYPLSEAIPEGLTLKKIEIIAIGKWLCDMCLAKYLILYISIFLKKISF